jgi:hypothetical protein
VAGRGAETLSEAVELRDLEVTQRGQDIELTGYPTRRHQA